MVILAAWVALAVSASACAGAATGDVGYYTEFHHVNLAVQTDGDVWVTETLKYVYPSAVCSYGYAFVPRGNTDGIEDVEVWEGTQRYRRLSSTESDPAICRPEDAFVYRVSEDTLNDRVEVRWFYPATYGDSRTFTLKYTLRHAVRIYPGGDQLWAAAIGGEHASLIYFARVLVRLPADVAATDLRLASYGVPAQQEILDSRTIQFSADRLQPGDGLETRVQWPHGLVADAKPAWQVREERIQTAVAWGTLLSLVFLVAGFLGLFLLWYTKGRDPRVRAVAPYLAEPPGNEPPALAGLLLDEKTSLKLIVATIVDLSRRGVLNITQWSVDNVDYEFKLLWDDARIATLRPYERAVLQALFCPLQALELGPTLAQADLQTRVSLRDVQKTFESYVRPVFSAMAQEGVREGLFESHPEATAGRYFGVGLGVMLGTAAAMALLFAASPNVLTMLAGGALAGWSALHVFGNWGFAIFLMTAFGAVMTALAILGQFVGRYTWYAALSPWTYVAFAVAGLGFVGGAWLFGSLLVVLTPALAAVIWSLGLVGFSFYMARSTPRGALERAGWQAFKRYLSQIEMFGDLAVAREIFDRYLPYAIAFGIEKAWVRKFLTVDTPAPAWFIIPALLPSPAGHYLSQGLGAASPDVVMATASLSDVSGGLFQMLGSVSSGLSTGPLKSLDISQGTSGGLGRWSGGGLGGAVGGGARGVG